MMRLRRVCRHLGRVHRGLEMASTALGLWIILRDLL